MAAGLGFKDFTTGEVLTAADVDGYLMQGVWVFASAAARDAAVTSPQEGNFAYLKDTNVTTYYTGSAWANLDTTGMTNPMTTTGDTIYSSSGSTPARLGIGTAGQVLTVNSGATAPEWATPAAGGGMTLINTGGTALSGAEQTISSIPNTYKNLYIVGVGVTSSANGNIAFRLNGDTGNNYTYRATLNYSSIGLDTGAGVDLGYIGQSGTPSTYNEIGRFVIQIPRYADTAYKMILGDCIMARSTGVQWWNFLNSWNNTAAITSFTIRVDTGTFSTGTIYVYGVN